MTHHMPKAFLFGVFCLIAAGVNDSTPAIEQQILSTSEPPRDVIQAKPELIVHTFGKCLGVVSALGLDWVEIAGGWEGSHNVMNKLPEDNKKVRRISVVGTLAGGDPDGLGREFTYRLCDLKVGDVLLIDTCSTRNGTEYCLTIQITRRPGGRIPPFPADKLDLGGHLRYQAEQDWEEKGIPIPKKYLDKDGRYPWTNPPYPPVAPMPREVER